MTRPADVRTFDDLRAACIRVLGSPRVAPDHTELLALAGLILRTYAHGQIPDAHRAWLASAANEIDGMLCRLHGEWEAGKVLHLEDAFGWNRPKKWTRSAAKKRAQHRIPVYLAVVRAINQGAKTPDVFRQIYDSAEFPDNISASQIEKWYYECEREFRVTERPRRHSQKSARISEKKKRA